jgi:hypothetical protein
LNEEWKNNIDDNNQEIINRTEKLDGKTLVVK